MTARKKRCKLLSGFVKDAEAWFSSTSFHPEFKNLNDNMTAITFDTHKFVRKLIDAGLPEDHAEAITDAFKEAQSEAELATKQDIELLRRDLKDLENRITVKLGGMLVVAVGVLGVLIKLL